MAAAGNNAIIHSAVPVMERLTGIHCGKDVRDENVFGTVIFLNAVPAGGTGDQVQSVKNVADLPDGLLSSSLSGTKSRMALRLSSICSILLIPESTIAMLGKLAAKRRA